MKNGAVCTIFLALCAICTIHAQVIPPPACSPGDYFNFSANFCQNCGSGSFSASGAVCVQCLAGTYAQTFGMTQCLPCPWGTTVATTGATSCQQCELEPSSLAVVNYGSAAACPSFSSAPSFNLSHALGQVVGIVRCSQGGFDDSVSVWTGFPSRTIFGFDFQVSREFPFSCTACTAGRYKGTVFAGATKCAAMDPGLIGNNQVQCTALGRYSPGGREVCLRAPKNCPAPDGSACQPCAYDRMAPAGLAGDASVCSTCGSGKFQYQPGFDCNWCAKGSFSSDATTFAGSSCPVCTGPRNYSGGVGQNNCVPCLSGTAPAADRGSCVTCSPGRFANASSLTAACQDCPAGTFTAQNGSIACEICPGGRYSVLPAPATCQPCAAGTASSIVQRGTACDPCDGTPQSFAPVTGLQTCASCPVGYIAHANRSICIPCAKGTFQNASFLCEDCRAQFYSASLGQTSCDPCLTGYYSSPGAPVCTACAAGKYWTAGGTCVNCPNGSGSLAGATTCFDCSDGSISVNGDPCTMCAPGRYGNLAHTLCTDCSPGQFAYRGMTTCLSCTIMGSGTVNASDMSTCVPCPSGTYSSATNDACLPCSIGTFSNFTGATTCALCPHGHIAPVPSQAAFCDPCPRGKYKTDPTTCTDCAQGRFNNITAQTACTVCSPGAFASGLGNFVCSQCPQTSVNDSDNSACVPCGAGTFSDFPGQACLLYTSDAADE